jgi:hypothetical protein
MTDEKIGFVIPIKDGVLGRGSGTVHADGRITNLDPPLNDVYKVRYYLPANAIREGSEAGWYVVEMDSPTTGRIFDGPLKQP